MRCSLNLKLNNLVWPKFKALVNRPVGSPFLSAAHLFISAGPIYHQHTRGRSRLERDRGDYEEYNAGPRDGMSVYHHHPHLHQHQHPPHQQSHHPSHYGGSQYHRGIPGGSEERYHHPQHRATVREAEDYHSPHRASSRRALNAI